LREAGRRQAGAGGEIVKSQAEPLAHFPDSEANPQIRIREREGT
jgi:hypothetical protein